jgi:hypothetical protein
MNSDVDAARLRRETTTMRGDAGCTRAFSFVVVAILDPGLFSVVI